jgi:ParB family chromosome partitioning protein
MANRTRRGGLGRGLGALIPTAPPRPASEDATNPVGTAGLEAARPEPGAPADAVRCSPESAGESTTGTPEGPPPAALTETAPSEQSEQPSGAAPVSGAVFAQLPIAQIRPNPHQPRQVFDEESLRELAHSVREFGMLQPVVVRPDGDFYELVMGERRLRAAAEAGFTTVPAIVRSTADAAMLRDALLENIHRAQLNPLEEAAAYQQLLAEFDTTHDELATRLGRSRPQVSNTIRLLNLPLPVQRRVAAGVISAGHARALLGLDDSEAQEQLAARIVAEGLSVRATEEVVALHLKGHTAQDGDKRARRSQQPRISAPGVTELADRLSNVFDTHVRVELGRRKGKITVEFGSVDDLERIVALMAPHLAAARREPPQDEPTAP